MSGRAEERARRDEERGYRVYGYRWVVLGVVMLVNFIIQILWIGYGSIIVGRRRLLRRLAPVGDAPRDARS